MGFRSTFITDQWGIDLPKWFIEKYQEQFNFREGNLFPMSSKFEMKTYFQTYIGLMEDLGKIAKEKGLGISGVFLHECGGISKVDFKKDGAYVVGEPTDWKIVGVDELAIEHDYCYGCSELKTKKG